MFCKNCGKMIEEDSSFCLHCGTKVAKDMEATNICERMDMLEKTVSEKRFTSEVGYDKLLVSQEPSDIAQIVERKEKRQSKKGVFLVILAILIVAFAIFMGITIYNAPARQLTKQLDLGNRCL